jgi:hypothetical protein
VHALARERFEHDGDETYPRGDRYGADLGDRLGDRRLAHRCGQHLLLTLFSFALGLASREGSHVGTGQILTAIGVPFVLLSAISASITLLVARRSARRDSRQAVPN